MIDAERLREELLWRNVFLVSKRFYCNRPTIPAAQWVRVEERLPGWSGDYICVSRDKNGREWVIPAEWSREMKTWFGRFGEIRNKVTHWMPLPEPPKGEKS